MSLALVRSITQSAVVLRNGVVVEAGPVQVLAHPAGPYAKRLMDDVPKLRTGPQGREERG